MKRKTQSENCDSGEWRGWQKNAKLVLSASFSNLINYLNHLITDNFLHIRRNTFSQLPLFFYSRASHQRRRWWRGRRPQRMATLTTARTTINEKGKCNWKRMKIKKKIIFTFLKFLRHYWVITSNEWWNEKMSFMMEIFTRASLYHSTNSVTTMWCWWWWRATQKLIRL